MVIVMNKHRWMALLMAIFMLLGPVSSHAETEEKLALWRPFLTAMTDVYEKTLWTLDYIDAFIADPTWDNLVMAKAACVLLANELVQYPYPSHGLSAEDLALMEQQGYDSTCFSAYPIVQEEADEFLFYIWNTIFPFLDIYSIRPDDVRFIQLFSSVARDRIDFFRRDTCRIMNAFFLPMYPSSGAEALWAQLKSEYPFLFADAPAWEYDMETLDRISAQDMDEADIVGRWQRMIDMYLSFSENQIFDQEHGLPLPDPIPVSGAPALLPPPQWYDPFFATYECLYYDQNGTACFPACGDVLSPEKCRLVARIPDVSVYDVERYIELIRSRALKVTQKNASWTVLMDGYGIGFYCRDGGVTVVFHEQSSGFAIDTQPQKSQPEESGFRYFD